MIDPTAPDHPTVPEPPAAADGAAAPRAPGPPLVLSGVEALARLLVVRAQADRAAGLGTATFVSGYPGSPLGTFDLTLEAAGALLDEHRIVHRPGLNEELAMAAVWGSQMGSVVAYQGIDGVVGAWYGKGPGLDRSGDTLKHANAMGAGPNGGVVLFVGDDPTAKSSTLPCDSQWTLADACVPVLVPADPQDVVDLGLHAFAMARVAGCWTALRIVTDVADGVGTVAVAPPGSRPGAVGELTVQGRPWRHRPQATIGPHAVPGQEALVVRERLAAAQAYAVAAGVDQMRGAGPGARLGIVCAGTTRRAVHQALADLGVGPDDLAGAGIRILELGMTYPLAEATAVAFARSVDRVVVVEEKRSFVELQLRALLHEAQVPVPVHGKRAADGQVVVPDVGHLDADTVRAVLAGHLGLGSSSRLRGPSGHAGPSGRRPVGLPVRPAEAPASAPPTRAPAFCSGCPHNRSTVVPAGALVGGGVGCHGIVYFEPRHRGDIMLPPTPMGAEGVPWIGLAPFVAQPHLIQNMGDGTLSHSGTLAIRASVAAGVDVTFKVLYNAAVAMTGGQAVVGLPDVPALTRALAAEGVARIVVVSDDPGRYGRRARWAPGVRVVGRDQLAEVQQQLATQRGVTVLVYDQQCAAEARRLRRRGLLPAPQRRVLINAAACEGCGDCGTKSNCLSVLPIATEMGDKRTIDDLTCNRDYSCLDGDCPSFVTVEPRGGVLGRLAWWFAGHRAAAGQRPGVPSAPGALGGVAGGAAAGAAAGATVRPPLVPPPEGEPPAPTVDAVPRWSVYLTGIGGTGVTTANRLLAQAAAHAGAAVAGHDQTGLSQKAGPVVSQLVWADRRSLLGTGSVSEGTADCYLSTDVVQAARVEHLRRTAQGRTWAVIDPQVVPSGTMLQHAAPVPDAADLVAAVRAAVGDDRTVLVPARRIAEQALGDPVLANVVLVGAAWQAGALPIPLVALRAAVDAGPAPAANWAAVTWGRWAVWAPQRVAALVGDLGGDGGSASAIAADVGVGHGGGTATSRAVRSVLDPSTRAAAAAAALLAGRALPDAVVPHVARRLGQLVDHQGRRSAERLLRSVAAVVAADGAEHGWRLTTTAVDQLFAVLAVKDEYEVARLHLAEDYGAAARRLGLVGPVKVVYHLHPPILRRLGLRHKLPLGAPYAAAFRVLAPLRRIRGTVLDPFRFDPDRRLDRALAAEVEALVAAAVAPGSGLDYEERLAAVASVGQVRGYGPVRARAVARWRAEVAERWPTLVGAAAARSGDPSVLRR